VILPTKGIQPRAALLAVAAEVLRVLDEAKSVSRLWDDFRKSGDPREETTFDWFVLSLDLLFLFGVIELDRGRIRRVHRVGALQGSDL
jgi:hypothetical protein